MKVLISEDSSAIRSLLELHLANWGHEVVSTTNGADAWKLLQSDDPPRVAILDWMMPHLTGVEVCRLVRQRGHEPYTYIILLTVKDSTDDVVAGMEAGADDYITKPFNVSELQVRLRAGQRIVELQTDLIQTRERLREEALRDSLTGLLNRRGIMNVLTRDCSRAARERTPLSVLMIDVDHFKHVNDTHGHAAGDAVLQELAHRMLQMVRPYDVVARLGGEEFLVIVPGCDAPAAKVVAERVRQAVSASAVTLQGGQIIPTTCSIGIAVSQSPDPTVVTHAADVALYKAKQSGRNCVVLAGAP
jgi:diguanylate cyclase (GGDEF)-like protein